MIMKQVINNMDIVDRTKFKIKISVEENLEL